MIDVQALVEARVPARPWRKPLVAVLRRLLHEREFQAFHDQFPHLSGYDFIDQALAFLDFSYQVRSREVEHIPPRGRVVIVANHPLGSLDALCLIHLVRSVRPDVKICGNKILNQLPSLRPMLFPVDNMGGRTAKTRIQDVQRYLENDGAVIMFPAGVVSRFGWRGIRDGAWRRGFLYLATTSRSPILPVFMHGRNSVFFYLLSLVARPVSTYWLPHEMFRQRHRQLQIRVGGQIRYPHYLPHNRDADTVIRKVKRHVYRIGRNRTGLFDTEKPIAHPEDRRELRDALKGTTLLGTTPDGKEIRLTDYTGESCIMRELGRLREMTFRTVGEGTGKRRDLDQYDPNYQHLLLWDDDALELVGGYRFCAAGDVVAEKGYGGLYSSTIYEYLPTARPYLDAGLELGRSFVQPRYWGGRSLSYLWYGIGAYIRRNPEYHYLFGAVSISDAYPTAAQAMLTVFYQQHFGNDAIALVRPLHPYVPSPELQDTYTALFPGLDYPAELRILKDRLRALDCVIPTLFKQYTELASPGGVLMLAPGLDVGFNNCVDHFVLVDTAQLHPAKYARYIGSAMVDREADAVAG